MRLEWHPLAEADRNAIRMSWLTVSTGIQSRYCVCCTAPNCGPTTCSSEARRCGRSCVVGMGEAHTRLEVLLQQGHREVDEGA